MSATPRLYNSPLTTHFSYTIKALRLYNWYTLSMYPKRPTLKRPPRPARNPSPLKRPITLSVSVEVMDRLAAIETQLGYRAVNLSALFTASLTEWLDKAES